MSIKKYRKSKNLLDMADSTFRVSTLDCSYSKGILALSGAILEVGSTNQNWKENLSFYLDAGTYSLNMPPELGANYGRYLRKYDDDSLLMSSGVTEVTLTERTRVYIGLYISNKTLSDQLTFMCNEGSTPLPYEPYDPEVWHSVPYRKYGTETDTITTFPATIIGDGTPIASYTIKGNTEQTGTPTPENPIMPNGCGVRTENLFFGEFSQFNNVGGTGNTYAYFYIPKDFTLTLIAKDTHTVPSNIYLGVTKDGGQSTGGITWVIAQRFEVTEGSIFTVKSSTNGYHYVSMYQKTASTLSWILEHYYVMLNLGSTALPYEPYGYKLPMVSNSAVTNIYLGEVQTTRRVKKLVLTGNENWSKSPTRQGSMFISIRDNIVAGQSICDRATNASTFSAYTFGKVYMEKAPDTSKFLNIWLFNNDISVDDFKSYLAAQYAAGTPVTVWYVLVESETGIVNEPLMKIGDYVDSVSGTGLATSGTGQAFDVDTTLKPSEADLTYHGWHEHEDTKYST